jgi:two-component system, NarL family, nitrate/nitrite response regulator NarL
MASIVCDDHPLVRAALALVVADLAGPDVATASDFAEAWALAEQRDSVTLCVVDLHMPGMTPAEGLSGLKQRAPGAKIVVVTGSDCDDELIDALDLGVDGYVPKTVEPGVVEAALKLVLAGGRYLPERVADLARHREPILIPQRRAEPVAAPYGKLSRRHLDVLDQLERGRSNKDIARLLGLSPATVKTHLAHIYAVLGASNRTEAAMRAREGLG